MASVCFVDRPAGTIAIMALNKTAEMAGEGFADAKDTVINNAYVDDIIDSYDSHNKCRDVTDKIDIMLAKGGFKIKAWTVSNTHEKTSPLLDQHFNQYEQETENLNNLKSQKVLGIHSSPSKDHLYFTVNLNLHPRKRGVRTGPNLTRSDVIAGINIRFTKRRILSWINELFDPLGLLGPFIIRAKTLMRKLWMNECKILVWDDPIPDNLQSECIQLFTDMFEVENIYFDRCIKPLDV